MITNLRQQKQFWAITAWVLVTASLVPASAAVLVDESFTYALTNGANLNGVSATGTGLSGNYTAILNSTANGREGSATYAATGLSFGSNFHPVSGGAAVVYAKAGSTNGNSATETLSAGVTATATGTVYVSYLVEYAANLSGSNGFLDTQANVGDLSTSPRSSANGQNFSNNLAVGMDSYTYGNTFTLQGATTYLVLARYTNLGSTLSVGTPGDSTLWLFDLTQYDSWFAAGANEAELGTFSLATASQSLTVGGPFDLTGTLSFRHNTGGSMNYAVTGTYDEFRVGTTLMDVTTIPEPPCVGLLVLGVASLVVRRRSTLLWPLRGSENAPPLSRRRR